MRESTAIEFGLAVYAKEVVYTLPVLETGVDIKCKGIASTKRYL
jgi:hypothetical protein